MGTNFRLCDIRAVELACHYIETMNILASWAALGSVTVQTAKAIPGVKPGNRLILRDS